ncbi:hypothetical protein HDU96_010532 [Phlyctochytrium bullatum]|nr:hypothetical protein HDU96_010532 [Phlyctochytrium bullatum]
MSLHRTTAGNRPTKLQETWTKLSTLVRRTRRKRVFTLLLIALLLLLLPTRSRRSGGGAAMVVVEDGGGEVGPRIGAGGEPGSRRVVVAAAGDEDDEIVPAFEEDEDGSAVGGSGAGVNEEREAVRRGHRHRLHMLGGRPPPLGEVKEAAGADGGGDEDEDEEGAHQVPVLKALEPAAAAAGDAADGPKEEDGEEGEPLRPVGEEMRKVDAPLIGGHDAEPSPEREEKVENKARRGEEAAEEHENERQEDGPQVGEVAEKEAAESVEKIELAGESGEVQREEAEKDAVHEQEHYDEESASPPPDGHRNPVPANAAASPEDPIIEQGSGLSAESIPADDADSSKPWKLVCIIGNAQKIEDAIRSHKIWGSVFPSFWYLWGAEEATRPDVQKLNAALDETARKDFHAYRTSTKKTWAQGIRYLLPLAQEAYGCEYIFTHDDDLEFSPLRPRSDRRPLHETLATLLATHQPAVAGFPWTIGDNTTNSTRQIADAFNASDVAPLAYFDSGMVLYHRSIVDLFVPYAPRGEGGYRGDWSLCAHFLNLMAPSVFRGAALRFNALTYRNTISLDNTPPEQRAPAAINGDGLVVHEESRHPYEYLLNKGYKAFLASGLHAWTGRWGRDLRLHDVHWDVETPAPPKAALEELVRGGKRPEGFRDFGRMEVLNAMAGFYDVSHEAVARNVYLRKFFRPEEVQAVVQGRGPGALRFEIHVFTMDRRTSFERLWTSVNRANRIDRDVSLVIHVDRPNRTLESRVASREFKDYVQHLGSLTSPHGPVRLEVHTRPHGLRQSILDAWQPTDRRTHAIFLEDDLEVSPHFLEYADQMVSRYLFPASSREAEAERCMGVSLYNLRYDEVNERSWLPVTNFEFEPYLLQHPQSWGAVWAPNAWASFVAWYSAQREEFTPLVPMSLTNRWMDQKSWKKYLLRFMVETGRYVIYPNFPGNLSLTTNHVEVGTNDRSVGAFQEELRRRFEVPLLDMRDVIAPKNVGRGAMFGKDAGIDAAVEEGSSSLAALSDRETLFLKSMASIDGDRVRLNLTAGTTITALDGFDKTAVRRRNRRKESKNGQQVVLMPPPADSTDGKKDVAAIQNNATHMGTLVPPLIPASRALPPLRTLEVFSHTFEPEVNVSSLLTNARPRAFDKCTMVMPVYSRHATILDRLEHYHTHPLIDSIILVWNNPSVAPPNIAPYIKHRKRAEQFKRKKKGKVNVFFVPIHVKVQPFNSMNNRYLPFPEIATDCVMSMDDDWDMPHDHLTYAIRLWQASFFNHLVGFRHLGRQHYRGRDGKWYYRKSEHDAVSIMLPSGAVYHRRFHHMYSYELPGAARRVVDRLTNCDDILFNMMVANATGNAPVVIDLYAKGLDMGGLWKEPDHFRKRSDCLQTFATEIFGHMPLRYMLNMFVGTKWTGALWGLRDQVVVGELSEAVSYAANVKAQQDKKTRKKGRHGG